MTIGRLITETKDFFFQIINNKFLLQSLVRRDLSKKYVKNFLGMIWVILDPLAFITLLYLVFSMRFADRETLGVPYILYLIPGYIVYNFYTKVMTEETNSIREMSFLLSKVNVRAALIPIVKLVSNVYIHLLILLICLLIFILNGFYPTILWLQLIYYLVAFCIFLLGAGWLTSSVNLFFPDIRQVVGIMNRLLFFLTPIFWTIEGLPANIARVLKLNPLYYIVNGYRDTLVSGKPFWEHPLLTLYFWALTALILVLGVFAFKRLRPYFADVI